MAENVNSKNATIAAAPPRTREEIAESLRVRTRRGTPTEKLEVIMTSAGLDRVEAATVMVIGLGGVGSNCVEALARGGVGHLIVIDHDIVGLSNINRQAIAFHSTLGRKKHEVVRDMVHDINPDCQVEALDMFLRADDVVPLLDRYLGKVDMLIDAIDSVSAKLAIAEYADRTGMPLISSMGGANKLHPECLRFADVSETRNDPLARVMRKECRKRGIRRLRVLYSCEEPVKRPSVEGAERRERTEPGHGIVHAADFRPDAGRQGALRNRPGARGVRAMGEAFMNDEVFFQVRYTVTVGERDDFLRDFAQLRMAELSRAEQGCLQYEYLLPVDAPDQVLLLERWSSSEAQQAHTGTAHFAKLADVKQRYGLSTKVVRLVVGGA